ncbi:hypothetical protein NHX12_013865 [Muraenolepis orangiensis]|uniref:Evolutionarily conserved signaling intermediate in Toll pathway, mitochondrial n=1 Tax=Muraenolepis orangiensis TaxID=630683 RepID=A0A9Q0DAR7_9TELE|nr:hypothetical protein NHX12_013865 [Muraenolepis orangiensis]
MMTCARCLLRLQGLEGVMGVVRPSADRGAALLQAASVLTQTRGLSKPHGEVRRPFHGSSARRERRPPSALLQPEEGGEAGRSVVGGEAGRSEEGGEAGRSVVAQDNLFEPRTRDKAAFGAAIEAFTRQSRRRRGHVEFIYAALQKMPEFGVERDLVVYNRLLDVFPKEVFVPSNFIQRMFNHYPRQQECAVEVLETMETYGLMPNMETKVLLVQIFGEKSHPMRKFQRLMYWFPKFKHANPFPVPRLLPADPVDLARFSLTRIADDLDAKVTVYQMPCTDITEAGEEVTFPHIVGSQSPEQMELLAQHRPSRPVFVEGPFPLWLRTTCLYYYVLRADPLPPGEKGEEPYDPERSLYYPLQLELDLERDMGDLGDDFDVDEVDEGPVFAMCMTDRGDQATLNQWVSGLQETNPVLGQVPTLFRLDSGPRMLQNPVAQGYRPHPETEPPAPKEEEEVEVYPSHQQADVTLEEEPRHSRGVKQ